MIFPAKFTRQIAAVIATLLVTIPPLVSAQNSLASPKEEIIELNVNTSQGSVTLETTIFKPEGSGPFPLLIMNHGKEFGQPEQQSRARYLALSAEFVRRGYAVVIPMRQGFSKSGGSFRHGG